MNLLAVVLAVSSAWFDADVTGSSKWPDGNDPLTVAGTGTWDGRAFVTGIGPMLAYGEAYDDGLSFAPAVARDAADGEIALSTEMTFTPRKRLTAPASAKAAITVLGEEGDAAYYGLVTNTWVKLAGATPTLNAPVAVGVTLKAENDVLFVRYAVDGTLLTSDGVAWLPSAAVETAVTRLTYQGTGAVASLVGTAQGVAACTLMLPETIEGMAVMSVSVGGVDVPATAAGCYDIPTNAVVTVTFAPERGFVLSSPTMRFAMTRSMELPVAGRPVPIDPRAITISEFMAAPSGTASSSSSTTVSMRSGSAAARSTATRRSMVRPSMPATTTVRMRTSRRRSSTIVSARTRSTGWRLPTRSTDMSSRRAVC